MNRDVLIASLALGALGCSSSGKSDATFTRAELLDPQSCAGCHQDHYADWAGSMHAYSSDDPVFRAMNRRGQRETNGALGSFCVNCHAPMAVHEGATKDGLNLDQVPQHLRGVTCFSMVEMREGSCSANFSRSDCNCSRLKPASWLSRAGRASLWR